MSHRTGRRSSSMFLAGGAVLATLMLATLLPMAYAGAVFEEKKPILPNPTDYKIIFDKMVPLPAGTPGAIVRSSTPLNKTSIPLAVVTLEKCGVLSIHFHPLGSEQIFILEGQVEVGMFFEDMSFRQVTASAGEAILIEQGVVHYVKNVNSCQTKFLQILDHPLAGAQFLAPALLAMPKDIVASAFVGAFPTASTGTIFKLNDCCY